MFSNRPRNQIWSRLDSDESDKRLPAVVVFAVAAVVVVLVVVVLVAVVAVVVVVVVGSNPCSRQSDFSLFLVRRCLWLPRKILLRKIV